MKTLIIVLMTSLICFGNTNDNLSIKEFTKTLLSPVTPVPDTNDPAELKKYIGELQLIINKDRSVINIYADYLDKLFGEIEKISSIPLKQYEIFFKNCPEARVYENGMRILDKWEYLGWQRRPLKDLYKLTKLANENEQLYSLIYNIMRDNPDLSFDEALNYWQQNQNAAGIPSSNTTNTQDISQLYNRIAAFEFASSPEAGRLARGINKGRERVRRQESVERYYYPKSSETTPYTPRSYITPFDIAKEIYGLKEP